MSDRAFRQVLQVATQIAERAADPTGFVPLAALAREIQADVQFRPLLVEGIAAQPKAKDGRWLILIDSETHRVTEKMWNEENVDQQLSPRIRNTVAHELAHALGPRCEMVIDGTDRSRSAIVAALERETERLSPALLIPPKAIAALIQARSEPFEISELVSARERLGVSSRVFVTRLELLMQEQENSFRHHSRFKNLVIGSGEWINSSQSELHSMPFRGSWEMLPEFVMQLRNHKKVSVSEFFLDLDFYLNGGPNLTSVVNLWVGTAAQPRAERGLAEVAVERVTRKADNSFLWTLQ